MSLRIKVAIAEDHNLVREGLKAILRNEASLEVVGEAKDGLEAVELARRLKPDVLLLDLRMPRLHGLEVIKQLKDERGPAIVVVTMHADEPYIVEALRNGVRGFVLKDSKPVELVEAIRAVAMGGEYLAEEVQQRALSLSLRRFKSGTPAPKEVELTTRERAVFELAAEGCSNAQIAEKLFISRRTAEAHRANLMKKLGLKSQTALVLYAVRKGMISP